MPINKYYKGHGEEDMHDMQKRYGSEGGKRVFYATANKRKMKPKGKRKSKRGGGTRSWPPRRSTPVQPRATASSSAA